MKPGNLFDGIPDKIPDEIFDTLISGKNLRLERIVSDGHSTPVDYWYDQEMNEWVILLSGSASILFEGNNTETVLFPGDYILIKSHVKHRVLWTDQRQKTVWLALHYSD
jgi:cupin 2 domain-containing protein